MNILIVSATYLEIEPLLLQFNFEKEVNQKLKRYNYNNHNIDVLIPGVGMTCTAYWMGKTLSSKLYDAAIQGYDVVFGRRENRKDSYLKRLGSKLFYKVYGYFFLFVHLSYILKYLNYQ